MSRNTNREQLDEMVKNGATREEAIAFFDSLKSVSTKFMMGEWKGDEIKTGFAMEGLLNSSRWYGKYFYSHNEVHPLVFQKKDGTIYKGNPKHIFLGNFVYGIPRKLVSLIFPLMYPFIRTTKSKARIRQVHYRGKTSASMIYDQLPIIDFFRKVDDTTVMGVMDIKDNDSEGNFFFVLYRN